MTIKNMLVALATPSAPSVATPDGTEYLSDFSIVADDPIAFESNFSGDPVGDAYLSDFATGTYQVSGSIEVYGRFRLTDDEGLFGAHQTGDDLIILRDGYGSDFALWADPEGPIGFDDIAVQSDFSIPRHVAETYPPPLAYSTDFADEGFAYAARMDTGAYIMDTGDAVSGRFRLNSDTFVLAGTLLKSPLPFYVEQMLPGTSADDRLGYLILGQTVLGGDPV